MEPRDVRKVGNKQIEEHYCFSCGKPFHIDETVDWCPVCGWARCPHCSKCPCMLSKSTQKAITNLWLTFCRWCTNPCPGKGSKRGSHRSPQEIEEYIRLIEKDPKLSPKDKERFIYNAKMKQRV